MADRERIKTVLVRLRNGFPAEPEHTESEEKWSVVKLPSGTTEDTMEHCCEYGAKEQRTIHKHTASFTDVKEADYYFESVLWAIENKRTSGVGNQKFAPNNTCTRGQIVTFLYRAFANE